MPPKKAAKPGKSDENDPVPSTSKSAGVRLAAAKANKRILKDKNDSDSDFAEETIDFPTTPQGINAKKKAKKTVETKPVLVKGKKSLETKPVLKKGNKGSSAQETRDKNHAK